MNTASKIRTILQRLAHAENAMLSFWSDYDFFHESTKGRDSISLFGIQTLARPINRSPLALTCNSLMTHFGEFSYAALCASATVLVPWFIASRVSDEYAMPKWCEYYARCCALGGLAKGVIDHVSFKAYTALGADALEASQWINAVNVGSGGILYTLSVPYAADIAVNHLFLHKYIHAKMIAVANYVRALQDLERCVAAYTQISDTLPGAQELSQFFTTDVPASSELRQLVGLLNTATFEGEASLLCNKGRVLVAHNLMHEVKGSMARAVAAAGKIDTYLSVAELVANHTTKSVHYTMVQFEDDKQPHIQVQGLWHPMVAPDAVVTNDIELGGSTRCNAIITGPNEGGKSTFLRSMAIALMLAQTFGVAPAHAMSMTPFSSIGTYLSIEDNLADKHSTFRSEAIRAQKLVDRMAEYKKQNKFCFAVIDELFKGTAHKEGQSIAYSVSKHLGQFSNGISLVATHYKLVTLLEKTTDYFANYRMLISFDEHGGIQRLFKLEPGVSTQNVALEVLASQGLAGSVIDEARLLVQQQDACEQESFLGR